MFETSRRRMLGASMLGAGTVLAGIGASATAKTLKTKGNIMLNRVPDLPKGLSEAVEFPID